MFFTFPDVAMPPEIVGRIFAGRDFRQPSVGFHLGHRIGHRGLRRVAGDPVGDRVMNSPHVVFMVEVEVSPAPVGDG